MRVKIYNNHSEMQNVLSSILQGSSELFGILIFIKDFSNNIKSVIKHFAHDVKLVVRPLPKGTTEMDLNKFGN